MHRPGLLIGLILTIVLFNSLWPGVSSSQGAAEGQLPNQLILSIYVDESGRCLVNGYVEDPESLPFLDSSEYSYDEESRQMYAVTNALTSKSADNWRVRFESEGSYEEYRVIFYLPADAMLSGVDSSQGLDYLVYAANSSVVAEVNGHDVTDPVVDIGYALPLADDGAAKANTSTAAGAGGGTGGSNQGPNSIQYIAISLFILLFAALGLQVYSSRRRSKTVGQESVSPQNEVPTGFTSSGNGYSDDERDAIAGLQEGQAKSRPNKAVSAGVRAGTEMASDIAAVMATLTDKEQSILKGLLQRGGRMTQRDISYETDISKSSLSGILTSMEKRKLIIKREQGRTNIIELSERFTNNKERL